MVDALLMGGFASLALVAGAAISVRFEVTDRILGWLMALASGSLVAAAALELFRPAMEETSGPVAVAAVLGGAAAFTLIDHLVDRHFDPSRGAGAADDEDEDEDGGSDEEAGAGWSIVAAVVVDGIPENLALGAVAGASGPGALVAAIFLSNFPEAINGSAAMRARGLGGGQILTVWTITGVSLVAAAAAGGFFLSGSDGAAVGLPLAVAGGGIVASLADTLFPRAYRLGDSLVPMATAIGFALSAVLA